MTTPIKTLYDISWQVDEPTYRADPAYSQSKLAAFERGGFKSIEHLDDKVESPSLTFGSAVDAIITGGQEEFDSRFLVASYVAVSDTIKKIVGDLFNIYRGVYATLADMPTVCMMPTINKYEYYKNLGDETRANKVKDQGKTYYDLLYSAGDRTILSDEVFQKVQASVDALRSSKATKWYFQSDDPFDATVQRFYQLKFKHRINDIWYRCMADEIIVNHKDKTIQPIDLKTSGHAEYEFPNSFLYWGYQIQARLYWRLIFLTCANDDYYKDFTILPYKFIVVNSESLTPLVWDCPFTVEYGDLKVGKDENIVLRDPFNIATELHYYLTKHPKVPEGIFVEKSNNLEEWLNKM